MRLYSYLQSAKTILVHYKGTLPFSAWLKNYFRENKKFGSKDRKVVSDLCHCYYRIGKGWMNKSTEERLLIGQFLCNKESVFIKELMPQWSDHSILSIKEKLHFIGYEEVDSIFSFSDQIGNQIDKQSFTESHLIQPDLFLRIRPGKRSNVIQKLEAASLQFFIENDCIRLPNMTKVDEVLHVDSEVVIQDKSSQQVINALKEQQLPALFTCWDCCAASGGKTILLHDHFPKAHLTVSDIRESILHNLKARFKRAGIEQYQSFIADVSSSTFISKQKFDVIICDAPCSGSGTWSRTPEQLCFFQKKKIEAYASLQKKIAVNAARSLKAGGCFLYITCSVFKKENEDVADYIVQKTGMKLVKQEYFKGYADKADTLFAALFLL
ncbi:MAG: Fmu (Sun) protein [Flavisolibacter sp.]|jgi:16S rRNA (cytosine967-C5)-methyltransferase|nr:Fmu (Sun) protein [Flavisolibacter sp.]